MAEHIIICHGILGRQYLPQVLTHICTMHLDEYSAIIMLSHMCRNRILQQVAQGPANA